MGRILEAQYLNVDFLVEADFDLSSVIELLTDEITILWSDKAGNSSSFGIESNLTNTKTPEEDIYELLRILDKLPDDTKDLLKRSRRKTFDIGFECGRLNAPIDAELSEETIQHIANFGCNINIKLYPWLEHPIEE